MKRTKEVSMFHTKLGWFVLGGTDGRVSCCSFGHESREAAFRHVRRILQGNLVLCDWNPTARRRLSYYAAGGVVTFDDISLDLDGVPGFHRAVLRACSKIRYGQTLTYSELATAAGRPRAIRAAGTAMARNPLPILIPCHRVLRSDGGLGGYSAPQGVSLKKRLLELEAAAAKSLAPRSTARTKRRGSKRTVRQVSA